MKLFSRILITLVGMLVLAGAGAYLFQRQIGDAVLQRVIARNVGVDRTATLPDGLHVYLCGTGSPMPDPARAGPCIGVLAGERAFVFDVGSGSVRLLGRMGFPMTKLERLYLTHLHSDHFDGLGELMLQAWVAGGRDAPLPIAGPPGVEELVSGFNTAYRIDSGYRTAHHGPQIANPSGYGGVAEIIEAPTEETRIVFQDDDLTIRAFTVSHAPVAPAFGYRIDYKGRSIAISGDTAYSANLAAAASGVDVLLHEALSMELVRAMNAAAAGRGEATTAQILTDIQDYHASPMDAARTAQEAGARELILYHVIPPLPSSLLYAAYLGDAPSAFSGRMRVGEDGMLISLPAGGDEIRVNRAVR
jgi:ribonuclease Z